MRREKYVQCAACIGATLEESVAIFNQEMHRLRSYSPTFERCGDGFLIYYTMEERMPETVVEAKALKGIRHTCGDCTRCMRELNRFGEVDQRKKHAMCERTGERVRVDSEVCDDFYIKEFERREA